MNSLVDLTPQRSENTGKRVPERRSVERKVEATPCCSTRASIRGLPFFSQVFIHASASLRSGGSATKLSCRDSHSRAVRSSSVVIGSGRRAADRTTACQSENFHGVTLSTK
ncbi:MAG: hypothetical protein OXK79_09225, partial [Chloroflexota bacterium]|nr:hypothetical protein [Chloroflexota bacterium]